MAEKDDGLGLSLTLRCPENHPPAFPMNLPSMFNGHKSSLNDSFQFSSERTREHDVGLTRSYLQGIDVNRPPTRTADCEEEVGVSSPNSTVSTVSGKRSEREENKSERGWTICSRSGASDEEDGGSGGEAGIRKKLRLSKDQAAVLEETFKEQNTPNPKEKVALAKQLNLRPRQVEVWFQNRRARTKLKQTEVDCENLKMCCDNLTAENRRLQKEVNELRALKLSPKSYLHMNPPTTLTMCPACERVAVLPKSSAAAAATTSGITRHLNPVAPPQLQRPTPVTSLPFKSHNPLTK